eukprot:UN06996
MIELFNESLSALQSCYNAYHSEQEQQQEHDINIDLNNNNKKSK